MTYRKQISEILDEFSIKATVADKIRVLKNNDSPQLRKFLELYVHHNGSFVFDQPIPYKPSDVPVNMGYTDTLREMDKMYLFLKDHPKSPKSLGIERKKMLATMTLEAMDSAEARVFHSFITNSLNIKGMTDKVLAGFDSSFAKQAK